MEKLVEKLARFIFWAAHPGDDWSIELESSKNHYRAGARDVLKDISQAEIREFEHFLLEETIEERSEPIKANTDLANGIIEVTRKADLLYTDLRQNFEGLQKVFNDIKVLKEMGYKSEEEEGI